MPDPIKTLLDHSRFQNILESLSAEEGRPTSDLRKEAKKYFKEIYTEQSTLPHTLGLMGAEQILAQGYESSIDVNAEEMHGLTKLMQSNSIAFVMTHKTYIDMFVLGVVLARYGLPIPYIFAGINMSFAGLGQLGRAAGTIFIRRSFKENKLYKASLRHFISSLVDQREHFMWAIEGTRSRTGKLVWPKLGILKYIAEASQQSTTPVKFVPVSIVYDLIPDVADMTAEGRGQKKRAESLSWFISYINNMRGNLGRISIRFGEPVEMVEAIKDPNIELVEEGAPGNSELPRFAFELVYRINEVTPVTTTSLVCTTMLSRYSADKRTIERDVSSLMHLIEATKPDALVDRSKSLSESIQTALNLLLESEIVQQIGSGVQAKYGIVAQNYLSAVYYSNMAVHQLVNRAFVEMAILGAAPYKGGERPLGFWQEIMKVRDLFKFEFFYSHRARFSDEIEAELELIDPNWQKRFKDRNFRKLGILREQQVLVAQAILAPYIEAYLVVAQGLLEWPTGVEFDEKTLMESLLMLGEKMNWQGKVRRLESVSKPFLLNGIRLAKNRNLIPTEQDSKRDEITAFCQELEIYSERILQLQSITLEVSEHANGHAVAMIEIEREIVPGSDLNDITAEVMNGPSGPHIAAYFDLDRTLIDRFSAFEFLQSRFRSGQMTGKEILAQLAGFSMYGLGTANFASMAAIGGTGVKGLAESDFVELGEEVYLKSLAKAIYPESRALVAAHLAKGHTVAIVSAATPYQVDPVARDLGIEHVMCTRMEVRDGRFTGNLIEPACWGDGKAFYGKKFAEEHDIDLSKSYFYTDSAEDMPLLEIVGKPRPLNPDTELRAAAFANDWPIYRFHEETGPGVKNMVNTGLLLGSMVPAVGGAVLSGTMNLSWRDGVNTMTSMLGDLGLALSGIQLVVKGEENLWAERPAVFIFNHQSSADLFIGAKLLRRDVTAIAKQELRYSIMGPLLMAADVVFIDRKDRKKAIEALKPAVEALQNGRSIAIAPEGTRSKDERLGQFKKGAFHLAMQAGVPIVPMVIRNAHEAIPKGSFLVRSTAIEVIVHPPIPTHDWNVREINRRVAEIRSIFLNELGQTE